MSKRLIGFLFVFMLVQENVWAQSDSLTVKPNVTAPNPAFRRASIDSAEVKFNQLRLDSLKKIGDSLSMVWIAAPDPNRPNRFLDSLIELYKVDNFNFAAWAKKFPQKSSHFNEGKLRLTGEVWVLGVIIVLVLFFSILKNAFSKELSTIVESFYSDRTLSQINKEDNLFSSWPFLFLYLLFGLTMGMFLYLSGKYFKLEYEYKGFEWFLILSAFVIGLFTLKIIVLRVLGFFFGIQKLVKEYVTILYLSYFNAALIFLPLVIAYSLTPQRYAGVYTYLAILFIVVVFAIQFLRAGKNVLSGSHFSKFYLFIYLCALEICPVIILIKALRF
ncbi:MAG TPA: DUF4271 domain-containing protein [Daejeonella sp.]|nr:DUF4271 domain-containing protein [Daejeonella sp.]